ncbi:MAG: Re/Si-specific NAD(P)(+) transhydrogenase subunit alpha [Alphaproteobacteria bacterium]|nr:Re/Si-specific NAD(P)(+) transhydrogenase subunit alpha [Alphaproteobacteria bacterium]
MKIGIPKETRPDEARVAAVPETIKKLIAMGFDVMVEKGAGEAASISDDAMTGAGASVVSTADAFAADIVFKVRPPSADEVKKMAKGATLISLMEPYSDNGMADLLTKQGVQGFALEMVPRITRAQSMDVLSSQSNLAGYRAVLEASAVYGRAFPMMMTAAGTVPPAKALVMGAGVAGLQAIATARRLGAVVSATDVRPAAKEQVESLGGKFVAVEDDEFKAAETSGGYAKEMSAAYQAKQAQLIADTIANQDIVITTALIPGRAAPVLVTEDMVKSMKDGAVIVDLAVEQGGNCPLSEAGKVVTKHGVHIIGYTNIQARLPEVASSLYAKNLLNFITNMWDADAGKLKLDLEDEIIAESLFPKKTKPAAAKSAKKSTTTSAKKVAKKAAKKVAKKATKKAAKKAAKPQAKSQAKLKTAGGA